MLTRLLRRILRRARTSWQRWSPDRDRAFHDALFGTQRFDPFRNAYPGYVTIRRFADLCEPYVAASRSVLDLGCGPGEITCELARRLPDVAFLGVDHSDAGIARAKEHAEALGLANATFEVADVERYTPVQPVDLVTMFDAFHHLTDPQTLVGRLGTWSKRFLLIEPRGDWKGSWSRELDFDWLALDLDSIRARVASVTGERSPPSPEPAPVAALVEEPIEHRYAVRDFEAFFAGYGLTMRGTVAGLEAYSASPDLDTDIRRHFGRLTYELYVKVDDVLRERDLDLFAKHLVIYAERGAAGQRRALPARPPGVEWVDEVRGAHDVQWIAFDGPSEAEAGVEFQADVMFRNRSWRRLSSECNDAPDHVSYHWLNRRGVVVDLDGLRSRLPRVVAPGEEVSVAMRIRPPERPGSYVLVLDLVQEGTAWYSDAGCPGLRVPFRVQAAR